MARLCKIQSRYCPKCFTHTKIEVKQIKKKKASENRQGQIRFRAATSGYGGFPRPKPVGREKPTRRIDLLYTCMECKKSFHIPCLRHKKFELFE